MEEQGDLELRKSSHGVGAASARLLSARLEFGHVAYVSEATNLVCACPATWSQSAARLLHRLSQSTFPLAEAQSLYQRYESYNRP